MRIIAGSRKGHKLAAPRGLDTRPTSDRVRENIFNLVGPIERRLRPQRQVEELRHAA
jgi:16S rRNA (guanine966-N2)-methyltransferase